MLALGYRDVISKFQELYGPNPVFLSRANAEAAIQAAIDAAKEALALRENEQ